jgi:hypothetical protein
VSVITFNFILKFTTKTLPNKKNSIYFVVEKIGWSGAGKIKLITTPHVTYYHPVPHTIHVLFRIARYTKNHAFPL